MVEFREMAGRTSKPRTVSLEPEVDEMVKARVKQLGLSLSGYLAILARNDCLRGRPLQVETQPVGTTTQSQFDTKSNREETPKEIAAREQKEMIAELKERKKSLKPEKN